MNNKLTIWILQTGEPLHLDENNPRPMRAMNLSNALVDAGHKVVIWSSAFNHIEKQHRSLVAKTILVSQQLEIRLIPSPGYLRHIGLARLWDHTILALNLKKQLRKEGVPPDVAFIGFPPIEVAAVMTRWLKNRGVPCMVDVKDQWPTIFIEALPKSLKAIGRIFFAPYFYLAARAMQDATGLSAMAKGFLDWAVLFAGRAIDKNDRVVPLTIPSGQVSSQELEDAGLWWDKQSVFADGTHRIIFVGSHSPVFDIEPVVDAAKSIVKRGASCQFIICGAGANSDLWRASMAGLANVHFPGWIDRAKIEALSARSIAALAPYRNRGDAMMSIPNKILDSMFLGIPILSPLQGELAHLIETYKIGLRYGTDSGQSLTECIEALMSNAALRSQMSSNSLNLYREKYSYEIVYGGLVKHLEQLSEQKK
jgi:glycosyltransferase involved in cell wall biosynthesis